MKKYINIILILISLTIFAYFPIDMSIRKDAQLKIEEDSAKYHEEAIHALDKVFERRGAKEKGLEAFGCVLYYNFIPNYILTPPTGLGWAYNNVESIKLFRLNELKKIYKLSPNVDLNNINMQSVGDAIMLRNADIGERDNLFKPINGNNRLKASNGFWQSGWAIGYADRKDEDSYVCYIIYPDWVGSKSGIMSDYEISKALEGTLDFFINDSKSLFYGFIDEEAVNDFMLLAQSRIGARLSHFENDSTISSYSSLVDYIGIGTSLVHVTHNDQKVFKLKYCNDYDAQTKSMYIEEHRENVVKAISIIISVLLVTLIVLLILNAKERRKINETVLQRIIRHSNPRLYLKNYDDKKVEIANNIYKKALSTDESDEATILELCDQVEMDLGINLTEKGEIKELLEKSNPKNFINPYNAEKVEKANSIYAVLRKGDVSYRNYIVLREEVNKLWNEG